ncbi:HNH endonuclease [Mycolicibacterium sp. XJ1819]
MTKARYDRHGRRQYQHADRQIRNILKRRAEDCFCGQPIDYTLPAGHPDSFEVDHVLPISHGGRKTLENARSSHRRCNRARSNNIDQDAIDAGANPFNARQPSTRTRTTTTPVQPRRPSANTDPFKLPEGCTLGPCKRCNGTHFPPGSRAAFITRRKWTP